MGQPVALASAAPYGDVATVLDRVSLPPCVRVRVRVRVCARAVEGGLGHVRMWTGMALFRWVFRWVFRCWLVGKMMV